jgi:U3 small nucleolar RNA-associated protein MPP10
LKSQDNQVPSPSKSSIKALPELVIDTSLVDHEQIYQQLQLYNNDSSTSVLSMIKFFSKCLLNIDSFTFNLDMNAPTKKDEKTNEAINKKSLKDEEEEEEEDDDVNQEEEDEEEDEEGGLSDDSVSNLLKKSRVKQSKLSKPKKNDKFGIPDADDSEISDFEVEENEEDDDDDDEDEDEEFLNGDNDGLKKKKKKNLEDIDSDEVDDDLVDLYNDLGDEKEVMGIGKPNKSFDEVDFDNEDFGLYDDNDENVKEMSENEQDHVENKKIVKNSAPKDLFGLDDSKSVNKVDNFEGKSSFEIRSIKLQEKMQEIHNNMLNNTTDKPWQLKGEVSSKNRPQESLLEEYLQFDQTTRQAPIFNISTTEQLEALIKQRIKDKAYDDVERKVKPVDMQYEYKKVVSLDQEKSKVGLSQIYEQEYLKQQQNAQNLLSNVINQHELLLFLLNNS